MQNIPFLCCNDIKPTLGDRAFTYAAPKLWNTLPLFIRQSSTTHLKTHLLSNAFWNVWSILLCAVEYIIIVAAQYKCSFIIIIIYNFITYVVLKIKSAVYTNCFGMRMSRSRVLTILSYAYHIEGRGLLNMMSQIVIINYYQLRRYCLKCKGVNHCFSKASKL